jgi:hypothetical protein
VRSADFGWVKGGPDHLERFGGAYRVTNLPEELTIIQRGREPTHFEIVPAYPMALAEYEMALSKIVLVPVSRLRFEVMRCQPVSNLTPSRFLRAMMNRPSSRLRSEVISQA